MFWSLHPFPCQGADKTWILSKDQIAEWSELYPGVDIDLTLRQALAWVLADPRRAKTAKGMKRFCVNWLNGAVNRGSAVKRAQARPTESSRMFPCPHVDSCGGNRAMCQSKMIIGPEKYPLKKSAVAS